MCVFLRYDYFEKYCPEDLITLEQYAEAIQSCGTLVDTCLDGDLRVPDFQVT